MLALLRLLMRPRVMWKSGLGLDMPSIPTTLYEAS